MISFFDMFRTGTLDTLTIVVRLFAAAICGGIIGIEREHKHRPAGFRTHILICLGAAITTMTSQYLVLELKLFTDMARLGAQVIAGIGFIGAGTIIVTKRRQVKGLTTAAGLWTAAIVGLCFGAGFFEGAIIATLFILIAELVFARIEYFIISSSKSFNILIEYSEKSTLTTVVDEIKKTGSRIEDMEITKSASEDKLPCAVFSIKTPRKVTHNSLMTKISNLQGIVHVEEL